MVDDMLSSVLGAMQVSGTLLLRETYSSPWAIDLPDSAALASVFGLSPALHVVAFHLVERGEFEITEAGERPRTIRKGEMAISFGGVPHRMSHGTVTHAVPVAEIFASAGGASVEDLQRVKPGAPVTQLICGAFLLRNTRLNPLIAALPRMAHVSTNFDRQPAGKGGWLGSLAERLGTEVARGTNGSAYVVERLIELLCAEAVREHIALDDTPRAGWFNALRDAELRTALERIHASPGTRWTVESMAACASLSRSRFAARFQSVLGEPPMHYLTKWRMNLASRLLTSVEPMSVEHIAVQVGYESLAAFSRAFKQHLGVSPLAYRTMAREGA